MKIKRLSAIRYALRGWLVFIILVWGLNPRRSLIGAAL